jgi:hypothetical protein
MPCSVHNPLLDEHLSFIAIDGPRVPMPTWNLPRCHGHLLTAGKHLGNSKPLLTDATCVDDVNDLVLITVKDNERNS